MQIGDLALSREEMDVSIEVAWTKVRTKQLDPDIVVDRGPEEVRKHESRILSRVEQALQSMC